MEAGNIVDIGKGASRRRMLSG